jgi:hypothetical protein
MIDHNIIAYIDNIFIYSQTKKEYEQLITEILVHFQK